MSKIMKMAALVLVLILAVGMAASAVAESAGQTPVVSFDWQTAEDDYGFAFTPSIDLFQNFKGLMPGDTVEQEIIVQNDWYRPVRIWLRADPEVEEQYQDFLSQLDLTVTVEKGDTIFEAAANEQDGLAPTEESPYGVLLGTFNRKGSVKLMATIEVPIELGNDYMNEYGEIPWIFTAEEVVLPDTPDTGDDFTLWIWAAVALLLAAGIVLLAVKQRKQRTEN